MDILRHSGEGRNPENQQDKMLSATGMNSNL
jgi:hypothetical protein